MRKGMVRVIYGNGRGKTAAAIGRAITSAEQERKIIMIQFLKGNLTHCSAFLRRLEPEFRLFSFEKREQAFDTLLPEEKQEEIVNIQNGMNFAKKVMVTGECDILILDEVLGLLDYGIVSRDEILALLGAKNEEMEVPGIPGGYGRLRRRDRPGREREGRQFANIRLTSREYNDNMAISIE